MPASNMMPTLLCAALFGLVTGEVSAQEYTIDGKVFGLEEARVYSEDYQGPPVVGEYLSNLPALAPLDYSGNRTHHVRLDTFAQEVEIAPRKRYVAWTFGGSAPWCWSLMSTA